MNGEFKAGLFVLISIVVIVFMTTKLTQNRFSFRGTSTFYAEIQDATGLLQKSKIKMSGLDVGQLVDIELSGRKVKLTMTVSSEIEIHKDATVSVKTLGFLGDKFVELYPGSTNTPQLVEGSMIQESVSSGGLEQLTAKTSEVLTNIKEITDVLKTALKGDAEAEEGDTRLDRIVDNLEHFTEGLAGIDKLGDFSAKLNEIGENVKQVTEKVAKGEGSIGKLINDTETIDHINSTLSGVNKFINRADKLQVFLDAKSGWLTQSKTSKSIVSMYIQPTFDKYYLLGITSGPQGTYSSTTTTTTSTSGTSTSSSSVREEKENETAIGINAQFAKRFGDASLRIGLFETTGGAAVDYYMLEDHVRLAAEAYRFRKGRSAQVNFWGEMHLFRPFYVWLGGDDLLNKSSQNFFIGGGLRFNDQDVKSIVSAIAIGTR
ncbi:MAG: MlaD family protein [Bacteriovoracia bacterium]